MIKETWREVPGTGGRYQISTLGRTKSFVGRYPTLDGKPRFHRSKKRYSWLQISLPGGRYKVTIHRLVWETFVGPIPLGLAVNHRDGNKQNNSLDNLEVVTPGENNLHAYRTGLRKPKFGTSHHNAALTKQEVTRARKLLSSGKSQRQVAQIFGCHQCTISDVATGKTYRAD